MTTADLQDLFAYTEWANAAVLDAAAALGSDAWTRDLGGSFPTLQAVLAHVVGSERVWLMRWTGETPTGPPAWAREATADALRAALADVERDRKAYLADLPDEGLAEVRSYTTLSGISSADPLHLQLQHVVNHSTYHRGQAAAMIRQLGAAPPTTDLIAWALAGRPGAL